MPGEPRRDGRVPLVEAARAALAAREGGRAVAVIGRADARGGGVRVLVFEDGETRGTLGDGALDRAAREIGERLLGSTDSAWTLETPDGRATLYAEVHRRRGRLFVVGAGHIGLALARTARLAGFDLVVLDDRETFAEAERFPEEADVRRMDFEDPFAQGRPGPADFVVLVTRAHRYDYDCLLALLDGDVTPRYIGMVGSRRRVRAAFRQLLDAGIEPERLERIHAPIGVEIGAETPEEIALSIAAEIVAVRRGVTPGGSLRDRERIVQRFLE
ncbi:MAG: XdhC family protein [Longimicrobiales bacterium]|nr:XdhC family protein [Longimicrobiales bacterium]